MHPVPLCNVIQWWAIYIHFIARSFWENNHSIESINLAQQQSTLILALTRFAGGPNWVEFGPKTPVLLH